MWYNVNETLSYNALWNFILGNRGGGKTFALKELGVRKYKKTKRHFIYMRRTDADLEKCLDTFYKDIQEKKFPNDRFEIKGRELYMNDELVCYFIALSVSGNLKSVNYDTVDLIIYDEFIVDTSKQNQRYLRGEVEMLFNFYETVARLRDNVLLFCLANTVTKTNPYFIKLKLSTPYQKAICCKDDKLVQMVEDPDFIKAKEESRFGKIIAGTQYAEYAIKNKFLLDDTNFVEKKTNEARYIFTFVYDGVQYGVWIDYNVGLMFVNDIVDPCCRMIYCISQADHRPNTMLLMSKRKDPYLKMLQEQYGLGNVRFSGINVKNIVTDIIGKMV